MLNLQEIMFSKKRAEMNSQHSIVKNMFKTVAKSNLNVYQNAINSNVCKLFVCLKNKVKSFNRENG